MIHQRDVDFCQLTIQTEFVLLKGYREADLRRKVIGAISLKFFPAELQFQMSKMAAVRDPSKNEFSSLAKIPNGRFQKVVQCGTGFCTLNMAGDLGYI